MPGEARKWGARRRALRARGAGQMRGRMPDSFVEQPGRQPERREAVAVEDVFGLVPGDEDLIETIEEPGAVPVVEADPAGAGDSDAGADVSAAPEVRPSAEEHEAEPDQQPVGPDTAEED